MSDDNNNYSAKCTHIEKFFTFICSIRTRCSHFYSLATIREVAFRLNFSFSFFVQLYIFDSFFHSNRIEMERMATFFCPSPKIQISKIAVNEKNRSPFNSIGANMKLMPSSSQMVKSPFNPSAESKELLMPKSNPMKEPAKNEWKTPNRKTVKLLNGGFTFLIDDDNHYIDDDGDV